MLNKTLSLIKTLIVGPLLIIFIVDQVLIEELFQ